MKFLNRLRKEVPEDHTTLDSIFDEIVGEPEIAIPYNVSGAATVPKTSPSCAGLCRDTLPVFGTQPVPACPAVNHNNRRKQPKA